MSEYEKWLHRLRWKTIDLLHQVCYHADYERIHDGTTLSRLRRLERHLDDSIKLLEELRRWQDDFTADRDGPP